MDVHLRGGCLQSGSNAKPGASRGLRIATGPAAALRDLAESPNHPQNDFHSKGIKLPARFFRNLLGPRQAPLFTRALSATPPANFTPLVLFLLLEIQRRRVHAKPRSRRPKTVRKHMPQVRIALSTKRFHASHAMAGIRL